jgi:hypothetical protein
MKSRALLISLVTFSTLCRLFGQEIIGTRQVEHNAILNGQVFETNDTLFFSYFDNYPEITHHAIIFYPNGKTENVDVKDVAEPFLAIESVGTKRFYYFLTENKNKTPILKALRIDRQDNSRTILDHETSIQGEVVSMISFQQRPLLISWHKETHTLRVYQIKENKSVEKTFILPERTNVLDAKDFQLISGNTGWIYQANSWAKVYLEANRIRLGIDWSNNIELLTLNENQKHDTLSITTNNSDYRSFVCDSLLFRYHIFSNGLYVKVYDAFKGTELSIHSLEKKKASDADLIYIHSGKQNITDKDIKLKKLFDSFTFNAEPVIVASKSGISQFNLTLGTFFNQKGAGNTVGTNPNQLIFSPSVISSAKQWREQPAVSRYFYCEFANKKIDFKSEPTTIHKLIDDYDAKRSKEIIIEDLIVKDLNNAYLVTRDSKSNTLQLVKISKK